MPGDHEQRKRNPRQALDPLVLEGAGAGVADGPSRMEIVSRAIMSPFSHRRNDSNRLLSERALYLQCFIRAAL
jgi:division protein 1